MILKYSVMNKIRAEKRRKIIFYLSVYIFLFILISSQLVLELIYL